MADEAKAVEVPAQEPAKPIPKMVPESDLIRLKKGSEARERKYREELQGLTARLTELEVGSRFTNLKVDSEEEIGKVREYLVKQANTLEEKSRKLETDLASFKEREREVRAKELAVEYGISSEDLLGEDDVASAASRLYAERLAKENEELKKKVTNPAPPPVYDTGSPTTAKKPIMDMNEQEFAQFEAELKRKAALLKNR